ncbi:oxidoreductase [Lasiosphaeris hirsuta]|uniref:Oxidoreductase n=1 Tax=Lasiosphaeris hirsuta TaxID=260670 RepID=A0AA39ZR78_9PEZI|nr:oxidoreductase [Lasiosphaeris hirsuta]
MPSVDAASLPKVKPVTKTWRTVPYPFISPSRPELSAKGRNVVITGGATGIGKAIAISFAQAGAKSVSIIGRRLDKLTSAAAEIAAAVASDAETQVIFEQADLGSRQETTQALQSIAKRVGGTIDVLVSNAGPAPEDSLIADATDDHLLRSFQGLVMTAMHAIQAFLPLAGPDPIVLSTNTCIAHWPAMSGFGLYSYGRAALLKLTDYIQVENPHVRVVSVQPGWVATEANGYQKDAPDSADLPGNFYVWLASSEAAFLKGKFVWANWDAQELIERAEEIKTTSLLTTILNGVDE